MTCAVASAEDVVLKKMLYLFISTYAQANPDLTPQQIKRLLIATARRLPHVEADRQGWGVVDPERAVLAALETRPGTKPDVAERRAAAKERRRVLVRPR